MFDFIKEKKNRYFILIVLAFFVGGLFLGSIKKESINGFIQNNFNQEVKADGVDLSLFWEVWDSIEEKYPKSKEISDQEKIYGAIKGLVDSLGDPYSEFFTPEEKKTFEEDVDGSFSGLGVEIGMKDKILTVIAPLKDTPAYKAGLKPGDKILQIEDKLTTELSIDEAVKLMRGEKGTSIKITIYREGENKPKDIEIVRDIINVPVIETELTKDKIFVIKLFSFGKNSNKEFKDALIKFSESKSDKLILDLRGNPGGYLESSIYMASYFLPKGKTVLIEDYGENIKQKIYRSYGYNIFSDKLKFVILIDEGSASASEILAGAMQDHKKAKIVGAQSYGKGSVQEVVDVDDETILKITIAKWLTPNGVSISEKGLTPDYLVKYYDENNKDEDMQMKKAKELLLNWKNI